MYMQNLQLFIYIKFTAKTKKLHGSKYSIATCFAVVYMYVYSCKYRKLKQF